MSRNRQKNMKIKVIVRKLKFDSYSENNPDYECFTDFDKYYVNRDKFSEDEGKSKLDEYFNFYETCILRRNHTTFNY